MSPAAPSLISSTALRKTAQIKKAAREEWISKDQAQPLQELKPSVGDVRVPAILKDIIRVADKICRFCFHNPATDAALIQPTRLGGAAEYQNLADICTRCKNRKTGKTLEESGLAFHPSRRLKNHQGRPTWVDKLPLVTLASKNTNIRPGTSVHGWRVQVLNSRLCFEVISVQYSAHHTKDVLLDEFAATVSPKRITVVATLKAGEILQTGSKASLPSWGLEMLRSVSNQFPGNFSVYGHHTTKWTPQAKPQRTSLPGLLGQNYQSADHVAKRIANKQAAVDLRARLRRQQLLSENFEPDWTGTPKNELHQHLRHLYRILPKPLRSYIDQPPFPEEAVSDTAYSAVARIWHRELGAVSYIPLLPQLGLRIPKNQRDKPAPAHLRALILTRDPVCRYCQEELATTVDHVHPLALGGKSVYENLVGACEPCNNKKSDQLLIFSGMTLHPPLPTPSHPTPKETCQN